MRRVHAFGDDALGDLDATALSEAIRAGRVGRTEVVEAAIARTEAVNPILNGLAYKAFEQARATASAAPSSAFFALMQVRTGRRLFGDTFDRTRLDALTLGLERHTGRNLHRMPGVVLRLRRMRRRSAEFYQTYDALLTPTLADLTPRVGHLAPTEYQQVIDRLIDWVAFTPLQNVTGDPAISLPLAQSADGMPVGMMLAADLGQDALLLELAYELEQARPWARIQADG
ncbi:amidase family protein [Mycobacterium genavense]|uniref:amidase family protein n=1 Tax=Mycobacterium genavense TaxID=36812 RepID=UPI00046FAE01|nr:amidase family protein [Mycobacterium genavense]